MNKYTRLNALEREEISRKLAQKCSFQSIAKTLGRAVSTISREVGAGSCNQYTYRAAKAQNRAVRNSRKRRGGKYALDDNIRLKRYVYRKLRLKWSPAQMYWYHTSDTLHKVWPNVYSTSLKTALFI